jgi:hypothetical protein
MGQTHEYVYHGYQTKLATLLPGVRVTVLGPPTLAQSSAIRKERSEDANEFWMFQAAAGRFTAGVGGASPRLFPKAATLSAEDPPAYARWFIPRLRRIRAENLLQVVRILDDAMNNTSVILLFETANSVLLFPGDAQIENWAYTLRRPALMKRLQEVTLYKVGHHGSRNATPKSLWKGFKHAQPAGTPERLRTVMSTMGGVYGKIAEGTEVPRATLLRELNAKSDLFTTQTLRGKTLKKVLTVPLSDRARRAPPRALEEDRHALPGHRLHAEVAAARAVDRGGPHRRGREPGEPPAP